MNESLENLFSLFSKYNKQYKKEKIMKKILVLSAICANLVWGSATVISGSTQTVTFNSEPEGAKVMIDGVQKCKTPCSLTLKRNKYDNVTFKKDGYQTKTVPLESSFNGVALLNVLWDFSTTDMITGAAFEYAPNEYFVEMKPKKD